MILSDTLPRIFLNTPFSFTILPPPPILHIDTYIAAGYPPRPPPPRVFRIPPLRNHSPLGPRGAPITVDTSWADMDDAFVFGRAVPHSPS